MGAREVPATDRPSSRRREPTRRRLGGDDGLTAVFVSLLTVAMLLIAAIVIDAGRGYFDRRTMQNAADSGAMAGTRALDRVRFQLDDPATVESAVEREVVAHGGSSFDCYLVGPWGDRLTTTGRCDRTTVAAALGTSGSMVAGVEVRARDSRTTFFGQLANQPTLRVSAEAVATIQPFLGGTGSPFVVCGKPSVNSDAYPLLNADDTLDLSGIVGAGLETAHVPASGQQTIPLQGAQQKTCGAGSAMKGKNDTSNIVVGVECADPENPIACAGAQATQGNGYDDTIAATVTGASPCTEVQITNCDILVPVFDTASGNGTHIWGHVVRWISLHITGDGTGNPKYFGTVNLDPSRSIVSGGITGTGPVTSATQTRVIKLYR